MLTHYTKVTSSSSLKTTPSFQTPHTQTQKNQKMVTTTLDKNNKSRSKLSKTPFQDSQNPHQNTSNLEKTGCGYVKIDDSWQNPQSIKKKNQVFLEGYVHETNDEQDLVRAKSLTDDDLEELKGCLDLGFGFSYDEIPELCNTLPALELCYSMSQKFLDDHQKSPGSESPSPPASGGKANWKISSPGDDPEDVKARLKFWAQAVACTVKLCS